MENEFPSPSDASAPAASLRIRGVEVENEFPSPSDASAPAAASWRTIATLGVMSLRSLRTDTCSHAILSCHTVLYHPFGFGLHVAHFREREESHCVHKRWRVVQQLAVGLGQGWAWARCRPPLDELHGALDELDQHDTCKYSPCALVCGIKYGNEASGKQSPNKVVHLRFKTHINGKVSGVDR